MREAILPLPNPTYLVCTALNAQEILSYCKAAGRKREVTINSLQHCRGVVDLHLYWWRGRGNVWWVGRGVGRFLVE